MNRKHRAYIKINIVSLFFIAISFISVTLAWFAYSGLSKVSTEIDIQAWLIEFEKDGNSVSNDIVISLDDIYPGMKTMHESVKIKNRGDSDAKLSYSIQSVRILDEELNIKDNEQDFLKDRLSHDYPFSINIDLSDNFILAKGEDAEFQMSVSWPLDSVNVKINNNEIDSNKLDSEWGNLAYQFEISESQKYEKDPTYQIRPSIKIIISAKAEQIIESDESFDINYPLGKLVLFDIKNNIKCEQLSENCIRTHVIDINNKVGDSTVTLLPDLLGNYGSETYANYDKLYKDIIKNWNVDVRKLQIDDILKIIAKDVNESLVIREDYSNEVIGYLNYGNRIDSLINSTVPYNGYYRFLNAKYSYLVTNKCYWLNREYNTTKSFALTKIDENYSKIYGNSINESDEIDNAKCSVVPVILATKNNLNN